MSHQILNIQARSLRLKMLSSSFGKVAWQSQTRSSGNLYEKYPPWLRIVKKIFAKILNSWQMISIKFFFCSRLESPNLFSQDEFKENSQFKISKNEIRLSYGYRYVLHWYYQTFIYNFNRAYKIIMWVNLNLLDAQVDKLFTVQCIVQCAKPCVYKYIDNRMMRVVINV